MRSRLLGVAAAALVAFSGTAIAADPDNAIKFRKSVMKAVGGSASALAAAVKGEVEAPGSIASLGAALAAATDPAVTVVAFKQNTDGEGVEKTTATAKVWSDWEKFEKGLNDLNAAAQAVAAKGGDVTGDDLGALFKNCKACHDDFREK